MPRQMNRLTALPAHVVPKQGRTYHQEKEQERPHQRPIEARLDFADRLTLIGKLADEFETDHQRIRQRIPR